MPPTIHETGLKRWQNWHQNYSQKVERLVDVWNADPRRSTMEGYRDTTQGLQGLIQEALQRGQECRAFGGGWSLSTAPATSGTLINTKPLNYLFPTPPTHPASEGRRPRLLFAQCGVSIAELNQHLKKQSQPQALWTSGASNGQTIAGATATGTHGAALGFGAVQDYVVGLHLIVGPGRSVWLERASTPVIRDDIPGKLGAELIRDDALFDAALVSFGSFGIVHGVLLETSDLYFLESFRIRMPLDESLWRAIDQLDFSAIPLPGPAGQRPYHFQLVINPHDLTRGVYVTVMYRHSQCPPGSSPPSPGSKLTQGDSAFEIIGTLTDIVTELTPPLMSQLIDRFYPEYTNICGTPDELFTDTTTRGKATGSAMGVPLGMVRRTLEAALDVNDGYPVAALLSLRYVKASRATLAFTGHAPVTCVLDIDGPWSVRTRTYCQRVWKRLREEQIPYTFHWGKLNDLDAASVQSMYGPRVEAWLNARRALLTTPALRATFANDYLRAMGLDA